jgi:repressor LexA
MLYTKKQREILDFISRFQKENGFAPTLEEIATEFHISRVTAFGHIRALEKKGGLKKRPHESRSIQILDPEFSPAGYTLPLLGMIQAGAPIEAVETPEVFDLTEMIPLDDDHFVLRVKGTSMIDEGVRPGDYVIVRSVSVARNGQMVVAVLDDGEATLKRFFHEGDRIRLQPSNESMPPIYAEHLEIRGVAVGIFRRF